MGELTDEKRGRCCDYSSRVFLALLPTVKKKVRKGTATLTRTLKARVVIVTEEKRRERKK
ncbi:hypothetical protein E2C01_102683 [Portunus trituberculatus]|uniref:Uncharacterized protein n=1 Tax=Portunus trituberculatus TaxID=210409 RepID=A0A5B7K8V9_PORTR|nr:hypothetical protein [Portunus trituberculatus]